MANSRRPYGKYIADVFAAMFVFVFVILNQQGEYNVTVSYIVLAVGFLSVLRVRRDWYLFTIYSCLLYCNYSIVVVMYLTHNLKTIFVSYSGTEIGVQGLNILCVFTLFMLMAAPSVRHAQKIRSIVADNKSNEFLVWAIVIVCLLVLVYGFGRPTVAGKRGSPSTFYEYSTILVILGFWYSGQNRLLHGVLVLVSAMYAVQNFFYGGRVTGLQLILIVTFSLYAEKLSFKRFALPGILLFLLMSAIGAQRARLELSVNTFSSVINSLTGGKHMALDTAYSSYHTSMTFLDTLNLTGWNKRFDLFARWVLSMFLGNRVPDSQLHKYTRQFFLHYAGGVLPYFGYFYLSWPGVALIAMYCSFMFKLIRSASSTESGLIRCITVYVTVTSVRWYLYTPSQIIRGVMILCVVWYFFEYADRAVKKYLRFISKIPLSYTLPITQK